jgi:hypothetical protein
MNKTLLEYENDCEAATILCGLSSSHVQNVYQMNYERNYCRKNSIEPLFPLDGTNLINTVNMDDSPNTMRKKERILELKQDVQHLEREEMALLTIMKRKLSFRNVKKFIM